MFKFVLLASVLVTQCMCHTYSQGECPYVKPIKHFDMTKFLGRWYAIKRTTTKSECVTYDFLEGKYHGEYLLEETSEGYQKNLNASYVVSYTGKITSDDETSKMTIQFPLNVAGTASFNVITTDYKTYAAIYTCQNVLFLKRQSATLLSRTKEMDPNLVHEILLKFDDTIHVDDLKLTPIKQEKCYEDDHRLQIKVKSNVISNFVPSIQVSRRRIDEHGSGKSFGKDIEFEPKVDRNHRNHGENAIQPRYVAADDIVDGIHLKSETL